MCELGIRSVHGVNVFAYDLLSKISSAFKWLYNTIVIIKIEDFFLDQKILILEFSLLIYCINRLDSNNLRDAWLFCYWFNVSSYKRDLCLMENDNTTFSYSVRETHQIAEAQQEKNAKLREAFGISEFFVEGSSLDPERHAREAEARAAASKVYELVRTPSPAPDTTSVPEKKKRKRSGSAIKKKKGKKHKKER